MDKDGNVTGTQYTILDKESAVKYVNSCPEVSHLFLPDESLSCAEIGDGNLNSVFVVFSADEPRRSILIKQALPYMRRFTDEKLSIERAFFEAAYYQQVSAISPEYIPAFYLYDENMAVLAMENLDRHQVLRAGLISRNKYPLLADHMANFLAKVLFFTSDFHQDSRVKKEEVGRLINPEMCLVTEYAVFNEAYIADAKDNFWNPLLDGMVQDIRSDSELISHVREMEYIFRTKAQALIHGDLHTGSIMVNDNDTRVIDPEFCFYGPMGFDLGALLGNYLLNFASQQYRIEADQERSDYQAYLVGLINGTWRIFEKAFRKMWLDERNAQLVPDAFMDRFFRDLLQDTAGFAGCKMIRRIIGSAHVDDLDGIEDTEKQAHAMQSGLQMGIQLLEKRREINNIDDLMAVIGLPSR